MQMGMAAFVDLNFGCRGNVGKHDFKYGSGSCRLQADRDPDQTQSRDFS